MPVAKPDTLIGLKRRKEQIRRKKTQDTRRKTQDSDAAVKIPASPLPSNESYTSRLLQAKKRAKDQA
jgi:hypothetical protein